MKYYKYKNYPIVMDYVNSIVNGTKAACKELKQACNRFLSDLENTEYEFSCKEAEFVIQIIEKTFVHDKGEKLDGTPLRGEPFLLEPWQKFIVYNLLGFYLKGTGISLRDYQQVAIDNTNEVFKDKRFENQISEKEYFKYLKAAFSSKRKSLGNNLDSIGYGKQVVIRALEGVGKSPLARAEEFSVQEFIDFINFLKRGA